LVFGIRRLDVRCGCHTKNSVPDPVNGQWALVESAVPDPPAPLHIISKSDKTDPATKLYYILSIGTRYFTPLDLLILMQTIWNQNVITVCM
jgi:hypothetical protein